MGRGGPGGDEAADGAVAGGLPPVGELDVLRKSLYLGIGQNDELLVGGRVDVELIALLLEDLLHAHGHIVSVAGQFHVEVVGEQRLELEAYQCPFGNDGAVLLLDAEEVLVGGTVGEDDGLAAPGPYLGASDVEDIAVARQVGQRDVAAVGREPVAQTGAVDIERNLIALAYLVDVVELAG